MKVSLTRLTHWARGIWRRSEPWRKKTAFHYILAISLLFASLIFFPAAASNPPLCALCHSSRAQYVSWQDSSHASLNCLACHAERNFSGYFGVTIRASQNFAKWATFRGKDFPATSVSNATCLRCHPEVAKKTVKVGATKMSHKEVIAAHWKCVDCHSTVGHPAAVARQNYPSKEKCIVCHSSRGSAPALCETCHTEDVAGKVPTNFVSGGYLAHEDDWAESHGLADSDVCLDCHLEGSGSEEEFDAPALLEEKCGGCHGLDIVTESGHQGDAWQAVISRMKAKGMNLSLKEGAALVEFLDSGGSGDGAAVTPETGELYKTKCGSCHGLDLTAESGHAPDEWAAVVERMVAKGTPLTASESETIVDYLKATGGAAPGNGGDEAPVDFGSNTFCQQCHKINDFHQSDWNLLHGSVARDNLDSCSDCHQASYCQACHVVPMPHGEGWAEEHGQATRLLDEKTCLRCHGENFCGSCHAQHEKFKESKEDE